MTDQNNNSNELSPDEDQINDSTIDNIPLEYSKNLKIGGTKLLVVDKEDDILSGEAPKCCVIGSPEHVAALKATIDELKSRFEQLEQERRENLLRCESVSKQIGTYQGELSQLGLKNDSSSKLSGRGNHHTVLTFGALDDLEIIEDDDSISNFEHHKYDRLMRQPRIRQYWHNTTLHREAEERKVIYAELFWDLIFVAVIGNLGHDLVKDISGANVERFILTFYPIWKIWTDMTIYMNFYSSDDLLEKFLLLFEMILVIVMGTHASDIFNNTKSIYLISYVIARTTFMLLHILHAIWIPLFRTPFINSAWGVFIPSILWIIAIFVPADKVTMIMWIAIIFENLWSHFPTLYNRYGSRLFKRNNGETVDSTENTIVDDSSPTSPTTSPTSTIPMSPTLTNTSLKPHKAMKTRGTEYAWKWKELFSIFKTSEYRPALNIEHYSERLGLFTIIALGEGILGVLYTSFNSNPDGQLAKALLGLLIAYNIHWIYFDVDASRQFQHALRRHVCTGILFGFIHFPLNMALIAFGASLGEIVKLLDFPGADSIPTTDSHSPGIPTGGHSLSFLVADVHAFPSSLSWLYCASLAIALYCMVMIGMLHKGLDEVGYLRISKHHRIALRFIIGTICLLLPLAKLNSLNLVVITSMLSSLLVTVEIYGRLRRGVPLFGKCEGDVLSQDSVKVKWRWGGKNLNQKSWHSGILRRKKHEKEGIEFE